MVLTVEQVRHLAQDVRLESLHAYAVSSDRTEGEARRAHFMRMGSFPCKLHASSESNTARGQRRTSLDSQSGATRVPADRT